MARADAVRAGQACRNADGSFTWRGSATLEALAEPRVGQPARDGEPPRLGE